MLGLGGGWGCGGWEAWGGEARFFFFFFTTGAAGAVASQSGHAKSDTPSHHPPDGDAVEYETKRRPGVCF